ncbi:MAG: T9SS type A sorting domain-containing protein [Bacteroidales bacterium]
MFYAAEYNMLGRELWKLDLLYYVMVSANTAAGGSVTGGGGFYQGDSVTVTATPNPGYEFVNWTEGSVVVSPDSVYKFKMSILDRTLVANFQLIDGIEEHPELDAEIYPNPAGNELFFKLPEGSADQVEWRIYNTSGQLHASGTLRAGGIHQLDLSQMAPGVYEVILRNHTRQLHRKIIVMDK